MVTIKNKQQKWVITEKEYQDNKATWDSRGEVTFSDKDPMLVSKSIYCKCINTSCNSVGVCVQCKKEMQEYDLQTEVEIKPIKKDAKKKTKQ